MKTTVFIHTNDKQILGAKLAAYSFKARSKNPESFDVKLVRLEETPHLFNREGKSYLRKGKEAVWLNADLQSFSPLRLMIPKLMNYSGRALLTDPDVFAVGDVNELLQRDLLGKAILCRNVSNGYKGNGNSFYATSVMLLDCEKLKHWKWEEQINQLFEKTLDYGDWISLKNENKNIIGELEEFWNHFDTLTHQTKLLHTTERSTQPWRTGLPVDFDTTVKPKLSRKQKLLKFIIPSFRTKTTSFELTHYLPHPDLNQEKFILDLMNEALEAGAFNNEYLKEQIRQNNLRPDIFQMLEKAKNEESF